MIIHRLTFEDYKHMCGYSNFHVWRLWIFQTKYYYITSYYTPYVYFRNKFSVKVSTYMMELYNDRLIDLFAKPGTSDDVSYF